MIRSTFPAMLLPLALLTAISAQAQQVDTRPAAAPDQVVISGTVPDETTKAALLARLREVYGAGQVSDQLAVGGVTTPPNWGTYIPRVISKQLKSISKGQLVVDGTTVALRGEVKNEATRQAIAGEFAGTLNAGYTIRNGLRVTASGQAELDRVLANRVVEFEAGSALLAETGKAILLDMAETLKSVKPKRIEVIGHTDNIGDPSRNLSLSRARAESVKTYLVARGMAPDLIGTSGMGADQPITSNTTEEGRRRNRRIEFRVGE
jgi:OmpA-OmpF porin, OOP family